MYLEKRGLASGGRNSTYKDTKVHRSEARSKSGPRGDGGAVAGGETGDSSGGVTGGLNSLLLEILVFINISIAV